MDPPVVATFGAIDELVEVVGEPGDVFEIALDVAKGSVGIVGESLEVAGFVLDAVRVVHHVMVDGGMAVMGAEFFAKLGRDDIEAVGKSFESMVRAGNGFRGGEGD